jgi:hypothetical protein
MALTNYAVELRLNTPSWDGMGQDHKSIFTRSPDAKRYEFVKRALQTVLPDAQLGSSSIKCLIDYSTKRPDTMVGTHLVSPTNGAPVVLHAKELFHSPTYQLSDKVYQFYNQNGISAAQLVTSPDGEIVHDVDGLSVYVTDYHVGRHPDQLSDVFHVAATLAQVHQLNKAMPHEIVEAVEANSKDTLQWFRSGSSFLSTLDGQQALSSVIPNTEVTDFILRANARFDKAMQGQMMMGSSDLIEGNVVINDNTKQVTLLDFDNIAASWMPEGTDIGLAAYRIVLNFSREADGTQNDVKAITQFLDGYNSVAEGGDRLDLQRLFEYAVIGNFTKVLTHAHLISAGDTSDRMRSGLERFSQMAFDIHSRFSKIAEAKGQTLTLG